MSLDPHQFRDLIERALDFSALEFGAGFDSTAAVELLLETAAVESDFGTYLRQRGGGPALGVFQTEPATFIWIRGRFPQIEKFSFDELEWNLWRAILVARCVYRAWPEPLPKAGDIEGQWEYYKRFYNSSAGATTRSKFMSKCEFYLTGL